MASFLRRRFDGALHAGAVRADHEQIEPRLAHPHAKRNGVHRPVLSDHATHRLELSRRLKRQA